MWSNLAASGTLKAFEAVGSYLIANRQAKSDEKWRKYNNALTQLQGAMNNNALETNENMLIERNVRDMYTINQSEYKTKASATVAAASLGVEGRTVDMALADIGKNAARARSDRINELEYEQLSIQNQKLMNHMQVELQLEKTPVPRPSLASAALGLGADIGTEWWEAKIKRGK